ncbi:MAG: DUF4145 domain-containing protein [Calditrichaeota bacterium]|nr:MAG: DUF4145 domain-containing protein [Calditrichota bacterium]
MPKLSSQLVLNRCPHCGVDNPNLTQAARFETNDFLKKSPRVWACYMCARCGGVVTAYAMKDSDDVQEIYPSPVEVDEMLPERARQYLEQAINSINAPAGAVMLAASAVDALLKAKGLKEGSLYSRIKKAAKEHLITEEMAQWAHEVRLGANEQRHADDDSPLPTQDDAKRLIDFVQALGMFLFILPGRVKRGIENSKGS